MNKTKEADQKIIILLIGEFIIFHFLKANDVIAFCFRRHKPNIITREFSKISSKSVKKQ